MSENKAKTEKAKKVFSETLRKYRAKNHWTQQEIAERCDMTLRYYQILEAGTKQPTMTMLFRVAESLEVSPSTLIQPAFKKWQSESDKTGEE